MFHVFILCMKRIDLVLWSAVKKVVVHLSVVTMCFAVMKNEFNTNGLSKMDHSVVLVHNPEHWM